MSMTSILDEEIQKEGSNLIDKVLKWGIGGLFGAYLVWFLAQDVRDKLRENTAKVAEATAMIKSHAEESNGLLREMNRRLENQEKLFVQICANTAKTSYDRSNCFR